MYILYDFGRFGQRAVVKWTSVNSLCVTNCLFQSGNFQFQTTDIYSHKDLV